MAQEGSLKVVIAALVGNFIIAITKFAAAMYTGSSAMLSEGVHSLVDTGNQALMLLGLTRSKKPPDEIHPFGYGMELYFWAFVVALLLFSLGAGVSIYEGILKIKDPHPMTNPGVNYVVLGAAFLIELWAWTIALKEFKRGMGRSGFLKAARSSKNPAIFTVLFEDTAALLGLMVAFVAIAASQILNMPVLDGVGSLVIGLILAMTAIILVIECKALLIGEAASPNIIKGIRKLANEQAEVEGINELRTMHLGPEDVLLALSLDFKNDLNAGEVERTVSRLESQIKERYVEIRRVFIEIQSPGAPAD
ncbi:MAG: cation diffusion facilitator family transporter [Gammaproteobacteria bacterium]|nr:cation diffusion facilitator family transporter [Gammaproteobacteria bacterium]